MLNRRGGLVTKNYYRRGGVVSRNRYRKNISRLGFQEGGNVDLYGDYPLAGTAFPFEKSFGMAEEFIKTMEKPWYITEEFFQEKQNEALDNLEQKQKDLGYSPALEEFMEVWQGAQEGLKKYLSEEQMENLEDSFENDAQAYSGDTVSAEDIIEQTSNTLGVQRLQPKL